MLECITSGTDLYAPELGLYVFLYNDRGAIAYYYIREQTAIGLETKSRESEEYWGAFLGPGGWICDPADECDAYGVTNIDFCNVYYSDVWIPTEDVIEYYGTKKE